MGGETMNLDHLRYFVKDYESALWDLDSRLP